MIEKEKKNRWEVEIKYLMRQRAKERRRGVPSVRRKGRTESIKERTLPKGKNSFSTPRLTWS